ncbi:MAG: YggS family pyridoxal phosphate-dependent enzyme, partial [Deltaproteobacteria bacterium]
MEAKKVDVRGNLARVKERIAEAAFRAGRSPEEIKLVAATKGVDTERIREAMEAGVEILGENYVQEARRKYEEIGSKVRWHMIGHLQTNKAKYVARFFECVHSVDSLRLAQELDRRAVL